MLWKSKRKAIPWQNMYEHISSCRDRSFFKRLKSIPAQNFNCVVLFLTPIYTSSEKRPLINDDTKGPLVAAFRSPLMKALGRSVETLVLWIVTSSVTFIKSANQCSIKLCLIVHLVAVGTLIYSTDTDGSQRCICKEGYTRNGQSCQGIIIALDLWQYHSKWQYKVVHKKKIISFKTQKFDVSLSLSSNVLARLKLKWMSFTPFLLFLY